MRLPITYRDVCILSGGWIVDPNCHLFPLLPSLLGAEHLGPDEVCVDGLLPRIGRADLEH